MIFYMGDIHAGHGNSIRFDNRPWKTVEEMDEGLLRNINSRVTNDDTLVIAGDLTWYKGKKAYDFIRRMNGKKILVRGNHDYEYKPEFISLFEKVVDRLEIQDGDNHVVVSHYPEFFYKNQRYGWIHLYAHVHMGVDYKLCEKIAQEIRDAGIPCRAYNIGCMLWNFFPVTLDEILAREEQDEEIESFQED